MKTKLLFIGVIGALLSIQIQANASDQTPQPPAVDGIEVDSCTSADVSAAALCPDVDTLFEVIKNSVDDSLYSSANQIMIPYKTKPCEMGLLLSARKIIGGVANTTPLHLAVKGNNYGITAIIFGKASFVGNDAYLPFARALANALDGNGKKAIQYTNNPEIINLLNYFTDP